MAGNVENLLRTQRRQYCIIAGECHVTRGDVVLSTVLGSCVSVCLFTEKGGYCGMNHFMLPCRSSRYTAVDNVLHTNSGFFGINAMEIMINDLMKRGVDRRRLKAKVFGGANVLAVKSGSRSVGEQNVDFILKFLEVEKIPLAACSTGGDFARKILFFAESADVLHYRLGNIMTKKILPGELGLLKI